MKNKRQSVEIEIKVQIENSAPLLDFLKKNAKFTGKHHQVDSYYSPAHRNFVAVRPISEWLRLRNSSGKYSINYKNWYYDDNGRSEFCDEYETPIESIEKLKSIFASLDIKSITTIDKTRQTWLYQNYEIAFDLVKDLGNFVEIEYKGKATKQKPSEIIKEMLVFLRQFNLGKITRNYHGYPFQLLFPNEVDREEI